MARQLKKSDCKGIREEPGTHGGITYHVRLTGEQEKPLCFRRRNKSPMYRCTLPAGHGTWHLGQGACKYHGGLAGRKPTHGRAAKMVRRKLLEDVNRFVEEDADQLLDLSKQAAAMHVLFRNALERFPNDPTSKERSKEVRNVLHIVQATGSLVDKISRIESRNALTAAQVLYLRVTMTDILMKYVTDPDMRQTAVEELAHRVGSGQLIEGSTV